MGKRLFIGNLSYGTTELVLRAVFEDRGWEVEDAVIVTDRETGRSRGFGFVELRDDAHARAAMDALDGSDLDGRNLTVREAHERARRRSTPPPAGGGGSGDDW